MNSLGRGPGRFINDFGSQASQNRNENYIESVRLETVPRASNVLEETQGDSRIAPSNVPSPTLGFLEPDTIAQSSPPSPQMSLSNPSEFTPCTPTHTVDRPKEDKKVNRELRGIHLFMITVNAVLGTGLYWRGGQVLEMGGALATPLAVVSVGLLSWAVMQCISEMLCIWPVPGALTVYVSEFVDEELGIAVGVAYWFTYAMSFCTLLPTAAGELGFWSDTICNKTILGGVIYFLLPLALVLLNMLRIQYYGLLEVVTGIIKMAFLLVIAGFLIAINRGVANSPIGSKQVSQVTDWTHPLSFDEDAADRNWFAALLACISIATFAFVGVEVVAASALEAKWPQPREGVNNSNAESNARPRPQLPIMDNTVKFSAIWISVLATVAYTVSGLLTSLDISRTHSGLPTAPWVSENNQSKSNLKASCNSTGILPAFVLIAEESGISNLPLVINFFIVFTCPTAACTNLYIASRALFGLASRLDDGPKGRLHLKILAWFGKTNRHQVPARALIFSAVSFGWIPFLQLIDDINAPGSVNKFVEVLSEMASVSTVIVWACECLAYIRFYKCIREHRDYLAQKKVPKVQRWSNHDYWEYPYRSHGQPMLAYLALAGCLFVLIFANSASMWKGFNLVAFFSSYSTIIAFLGLWIVLKLDRQASWTPVDLSNKERVVWKLQGLHDVQAKFAGSNSKIEEQSAW